MAKKLFEQLSEGREGLIKDSIDDEVHEIEDYLSEEYHDIKNDLVHGMSPMDSETWKNDTWAQREKSGAFRFVLHFIFIALPYLFFDVFFQVINLCINMLANHWWGNGNLILVYNSGVSLFQGLTSLFLVAELPSYLKNNKVVRGFSFMLAVIYNTFWVWSAVEVWYGSI